MSDSAMLETILREQRAHRDETRSRIAEIASQCASQGHEIVRLSERMAGVKDGVDRLEARVETRMNNTDRRATGIGAVVALTVTGSIAAIRAMWNGT